MGHSSGMKPRCSPSPPPPSPSEGCVETREEDATAAAAAAASTRQRQRPRLAWAMYDWANSAFATTVVAGFFPAVFKDYWADNLAPTVSTFWLGAALTTASAIVAIAAPVLGGIADRNGKKKAMLIAFAAVGIFASMALAFVGRFHWQLALAFYVLAYVGWLASVVFYDALLPSVSTERDVDRVSSLGYALGYLGGGLLFAVNVAAYLAPQAFGIHAASIAEARMIAIKGSFISVGVWWALFSIPLLIAVRERKPTPPPLPPSHLQFKRWRSGIDRALAGFRRVQGTPNVLRFLIAYWLYIDGIDTVVAMAIDFGKAIGIGTSELIGALLMVQFVAFPFAWAFGRASERVGPKPMILIGLAVYVVITTFGSQLQKEPILVVSGVPISGFFVLAFLVGAVQGGVQALSRSFFARLVPSGHEGELFGFYNMVGKFAAIVGPILVGTVGRLTGSARTGIFSLVILFVGGALLLWRVPANATAKRAQTVRLVAGGAGP